VGKAVWADRKQEAGRRTQVAQVVNGGGGAGRYSEQSELAEAATSPHARNCSDSIYIK
jgi:hypothetical protein